LWSPLFANPGWAVDLFSKSGSPLTIEYRLIYGVNADHVKTAHVPNPPSTISTLPVLLTRGDNIAIMRFQFKNDQAIEWTMFAKKKLLIVLFALSLSACMPKGPQVPTIIGQSPEDLFFLKAETAFQQQQLDQALSIYSQYIVQYPQGDHVDLALSRIAFIYKTQGIYDASQAFYERLLREFPDSPYRDEARLGIVDLYILSNRPADAIELAQQMLATELSTDIRRQLWERLSRQYEAAGSLANSTAYGYMLYKSAPESDKEQWVRQLKQSIDQLNIQDIEMLWDQIDDSRIRSYLMYRYAVLQVVGENYDDALELLAAFQEKYPDHPDAAEAAQLVEMLYQRLTFQPMTVGCLLPLSGAYQLYGQRALTGIELALSLMQNGEEAKPIRLVIKDTASEDSRAVQAVRAMGDERVGAIIGPIITAPAAAREAQRLNIPMVTFTQKPGVTDIGDYIFRHFITPQSQVKALVNYFVRHIGLRDFAIMYPREVYGKTFMTLFWDEVIRQGGRVRGVEAYDLKQTDFAGTIRKLVGTHYSIPADLQARSFVQLEENPYIQIRGADGSNHLDQVLSDPVTRLTGLFFQDPDQDRIKGPAIGRAQKQEKHRPVIDFDVLFIPDAPKTAGLILPQLAYHDVKDIYLAGTNLWHSSQLIEMTHAYAQNAVITDGFFADSRNEIVQNFVSTYHQIYNRQPGIIEAFAFDTATMLFNLISQSQATHRHILRDNLLQWSQVRGVTGPVTFEANGEAIKTLCLLRIKGGQFLEIPQP
jgi:ABC-type branched-subunit amino acid transport system substrate-binding protein/outer membrane protein assembly factor BamD (BamD/ComL family)